MENLGGEKSKININTELEVAGGEFGKDDIDRDKSVFFSKH